MNDKEFKEVIALIDKQVQNFIKNIIYDRRWCFGSVIKSNTQKV